MVRCVRLYSVVQTFEFLMTKYGPPVGNAVPLGKLVMAAPEDGCVPPGTALANAHLIAGNIAVMIRGTCMFPDKVSLNRVLMFTV
jgi:hypothetical protein